MNEPGNTNALRDFHSRIGTRHLAPLWQMGGRPPRPESPCVPALWRYRDVRPYLLEACELISAHEAERRVLVLENPGQPGSFYVTRSLYAGLQIIRPGEIAPSHRHTASALRFVIEGYGAYTAVDGERLTMRPGDFVVTPSWTWHDHGNLGPEPVVWLDALDTPIVNLFDAPFREPHPTPEHPLTRAEGSTLARFGASMLPVDHRPSDAASPLLVYPYERSRAALERLARDAPADASHGHKLRYANPATGGFPFPTMAAFMQLLPAGFRGSPYRSTDSTVFAIAEGRGAIVVDETRFDFTQHDTIVVPSWQPYAFETPEQSIIFSFSDRAAQTALGLWRESAG